MAGAGSQRKNRQGRILGTPATGSMPHRSRRARARPSTDCWRPAPNSPGQFPCARYRTREPRCRADVALFQLVTSIRPASASSRSRLSLIAGQQPIAPHHKRNRCAMPEYPMHLADQDRALPGSPAAAAFQRTKRRKIGSPSAYRKLIHLHAVTALGTRRGRCTRVETGQIETPALLGRGPVRSRRPNPSTPTMTWSIKYRPSTPEFAPKPWGLRCERESISRRVDSSADAQRNTSGADDRCSDPV